MSDADEAQANHLIAEVSCSEVFLMQLLGARFAGCSLFEEHCRRWYLNCRCWSLVPFVQPLWTRTSPLTHPSSFYVHVHIAALTQLWICQGKWGRQGFLWISHSTWFFLYFCVALEADLQLCSWCVCTTVCLYSDAAGAEQWGQSSEPLEGWIQCGSCVVLAAAGAVLSTLLCPSPSSPPAVALPAQISAADLRQ